MAAHTCRRAAAPPGMAAFLVALLCVAAGAREAAHTPPGPAWERRLDAASESQSQSSSLTGSPSPTASSTPSAAATASPSPTASSTPSAAATGTATPSRTPSVTPSLSSSRSQSPTPSGTQTLSPSESGTRSLSPSETGTRSQSPSETSSQAPTPSQTPSQAPTPSQTPSVTASLSETPSQTPSQAPTPSQTASVTATQTKSSSSTPSPAATRSQSRSATRSPSQSSTLTPSLSASSTATRSVSGSRSGTRTPSLTQSQSRTQTQSGTQTRSLTSTISATPSLTQTPTATSTPSVTATVTRTRTQTGTATITQTPSLSASPTGTRSVSPTPTLTPSQSRSQSKTPSVSPSLTKSVTASLTQTRSQTMTRSVTRSRTGSRSYSSSNTNSMSSSPSNSPSMSSSPSNSPSFSATPSQSPSTTGSPSITQTDSSSSTPSESVTPSQSLTPSPSGSPSQTTTPSNARTPSRTRSGSVTGTRTQSRSRTQSQTSSRTRTSSQTGSRSGTVTRSGTGSISMSGTGSQSGSGSLSVTTSQSQSASASRSPTQSASLTQSSSMEGTQSTTGTGTQAATVSSTPTLTGSRSQDGTITPSGTPTPSATPSQTGTRTLTGTATPSQRATPTRSLSQTGTRTPTLTRTRSPTGSPSASGTPSQTGSPTPSNSRVVQTIVDNTHDLAALLTTDAASGAVRVPALSSAGAVWSFLENDPGCGPGSYALESASLGVALYSTGPLAPSPAPVAVSFLVSVFANVAGPSGTRPSGSALTIKTAALALVPGAPPVFLTVSLAGTAVASGNATSGATARNFSVLLRPDTDIIWAAPAGPGAPPGQLATGAVVAGVSTPTAVSSASTWTTQAPFGTALRLRGLKVSCRPSLTPTSTRTPSVTASRTRTASQTPSYTASATQTPSESTTGTASLTQTGTVVLTESLTMTASLTPSITASQAATATATQSRTASWTRSQGSSLSLSSTQTPTQTASLTAGLPPSTSPTQAATRTLSPSGSPSQAATPTGTPSQAASGFPVQPVFGVGGGGGGSPGLGDAAGVLLFGGAAQAGFSFAFAETDANCGPGAYTLSGFGLVLSVVPPSPTPTASASPSGSPAPVNATNGTQADAPLADATQSNATSVTTAAAADNSTMLVAAAVVLYANDGGGFPPAPGTILAATSVVLVVPGATAPRLVSAALPSSFTVASRTDRGATLTYTLGVLPASPIAWWPVGDAGGGGGAAGSGYTTALVLNNGSSPAWTILPASSVPAAALFAAKRGCSATPTRTLTPSASITSTRTASVSGTSTASQAVTLSQAPSASLSPSASYTASQSPSVSGTPTLTVTPGRTPSKPPTASHSPTETRTASVTTSLSQTLSSGFSRSPSQVPSPSSSPSPSLSGTASSTSSASQSSSATGSASYTASVSQSPTFTVSQTQSSTPSPAPSNGAAQPYVGVALALTFAASDAASYASAWDGAAVDALVAAALAAATNASYPGLSASVALLSATVDGAALVVGRLAPVTVAAGGAGASPSSTASPAATGAAASTAAAAPSPAALSTVSVSLVFSGFSRGRTAPGLVATLAAPAGAAAFAAAFSAAIGASSAGQPGSGSVFAELSSAVLVPGSAASTSSLSPPPPSPSAAPIAVATLALEVARLGGLSTQVRVVSPSLLLRAAAPLRVAPAAAATLTAGLRRATGPGGINNLSTLLLPAASSGALQALLQWQAPHAGDAATGTSTCDSALFQRAAGVVGGTAGAYSTGTGAAYATGLLAAHVDAAEPVLLVADVFAQLPRPSGSKAAAQVVRPVPVSASRLWVPIPATAAAAAPPDPRLELFRSLAALAAGPGAAQADAAGTPTGLLLTVASVTWTVAGCTATNVSSSRACSPGGANFHGFNATSPGLALDVGPLLRAGHVYAAAASVVLSAEYAWGALPFLSRRAVRTGAAAGATLFPSTLGANATASAAAAWASVAALSDRMAVGRPATTTGPTVRAPAAAAAVLATHMPPALGNVTASPAAGTAFVSEFSLLTAGWAVWGGAEKALLVTAAGAPLPAAAASAAWVMGAPPLPPQSLCDAAQLSTGSTSPPAAFAPAAACPADIGALTDGSAAGAPATFTAPLWLLHLALVSQAAGTGSAGLPGLCASVRGFASRAVATVSSNCTNGSAVAAVGGPCVAPGPPSVALQFRLQADGNFGATGLPVVASSGTAAAAAVVTDTAGVLASQPALRDSDGWPGTPLSVPATVRPVAPFRATGVFLSASSSATAAGDAPTPIVAGNAATVAGVWVFAEDEWGAVGVAYVPVSLLPPLVASQRTDAAAVASFVSSLASTLTPAVAAGNPFRALLAAQAVGTALTGASTTSAATAGLSASALASLTASNAVARGQAIAAVAAALPAVFSNATDASTISLVFAGLGGLTADPAELPQTAGATAVDALGTLLGAVFPAAPPGGSSSSSSGGSCAALLQTSPSASLSTSQSPTASQTQTASASQQGTPSGSPTTPGNATASGSPTRGATPSPSQTPSASMSVPAVASGGGGSDSGSAADIGLSSGLDCSAATAAASTTAIPASLAQASLDIVSNAVAPVIAQHSAAGTDSAAGISAGLKAALDAALTALAAATLSGTGPGNSTALCSAAFSFYASRLDLAGPQAGAGNASAPAAVLSGAAFASSCAAVGRLLEDEEEETGGGRRAAAASQSVSVALDYGALSRVAGASGGSVDVVVTQWGASPHPERSGWVGVNLAGTPAGLASPVVAVSLLSSATGAALAVPSLQPPLLLTLPYSNPGAVAGNGSAPLSLLAVQAPPPVFALACPSQLQLSSGAVRVGSTLPLARISGGGGGTGTATLATVTGVTSALVDAAVTTTQPLADSPPFRRRSRALVQVTRYAASVNVPCGGALGTQAASCSTDGGNVTFRCAPLLLRPACGFWRADTAGWSTEGCALVAVGASNFSCACSHLTEFAGRFGSLVAPQAPAAFVSAPTVAVPGSAESFAVLPVLLGCIGAAYALLLVWGARADRRGRERFYRALWADDEVAALRKAAAVQGAPPFILDRAIDAAGGAALHARFLQTEALVARLENAELTRAARAALLPAILAAPVDAAAAAAEASQGVDDVVEPLAELVAAHDAVGTAAHPAAAALYLRAHVRCAAAGVSFSGGVDPMSSSSVAHDGASEGGRTSGSTAEPPISAPQAASLWRRVRANAAALERGRRGSFVCSLWAATLCLRHGHTGTLARFDPWQPRSSRATRLVAGSLVSLFAAAFFYSRRNGSPGEAIPAAAVAEQVVLGLIAAAIAVAVDAALGALFLGAGTAEFAWRHGPLLSEVALRRQVAPVLALRGPPSARQMLRLLEAAAAADAGAMVAAVPPLQRIAAEAAAAAVAAGGADLDARTPQASAATAAAAGRPLPPTSAAEGGEADEEDRGVLDDLSEFGDRDGSTIAELRTAAAPPAQPPTPVPLQPHAKRASHRSQQRSLASLRPFAGRVGRRSAAPQAAAAVEGAEGNDRPPAPGRGGVSPAAPPPPRAIVPRRRMSAGRRLSVGRRSALESPPPGVVRSIVSLAEVAAAAAAASAAAAAPADVMVRIDRGGEEGEEGEDDPQQQEPHARALWDDDVAEAAGLRMGGGGKRRPRDTAAIARLRAESARRDYVLPPAPAPPRFRLCLCLCTLRTGAAYLAALALMAFCLWYLALFGMRQPTMSTQSVVAAWAWALAFRVIVAEPALELASVAWAVAGWPAVAPSVAWSLSAAASAPVAEALSGAAGTAGALTRRLERLALLRAAAAGAGIAPDVAAVVFAQSLGSLTVAAVASAPRPAAADATAAPGAPGTVARGMRQAYAVLRLGRVASASAKK